MRHTGLLGWGGVVLAMVSCAAPTPTPAPAPEVRETAAPQRPSEWGGERVHGGRRVALLVGADRHKNQPAWDVPFVAANVELLRAALVAHAGYAPEDVLVLTGERVTRDQVKSALVDDCARRLSGPADRLLVYWSGHGATDSAGAPFFFTHLTAEVGGGGWRETLAWDELAAAVGGALSAVRTRGGEPPPVALVVDACRSETLAPPREATLTTVANAVVSSCRRFQLANADPRSPHSVFTAALAEAMAARAGRGTTRMRLWSARSPVGV